MRVALALAVLAAACGGGATRRIAIEEVPIGGLGRPLAVELPELTDEPLRHVVLLIGDGMGAAQLQAARLAAFGPDGRFVCERFPIAAWLTTHATDSPIGESGAAATALATGVRTARGRIGTAPDGRVLPTILERAHAAGWVTGLATSTSIFDATPAAFVAHVDHRGEHDAIAGQLAAAGVDLLAGVGRERFLPVARDGQRRDGSDLLAAARARGTTVVSDLAGLAAAQTLPLWALFSGSLLGEEPRQPTVAELAERALALMAAEATRRDRGLFLLIEEEGIDSGAHDNSLTRMTAALLRFDAAVAVAARFAAADGATLLLVTGDHATGGLSIDYETTSARLRVAWASRNHSGEPVPLFAYGPAAAAARVGRLRDQTELTPLLAELLGLAPLPEEDGAR